MVTVDRQGMTAAEYLTLPASNVPMELVDGEVSMAPAPELQHQQLVFELAKLIEKVADSGKVYLSPVDVHFNDLNVVQPDVLWIGPESQCQAVDGKYLSGPPDLIVEIFSPGSIRRDRSTKFKLYERFGVQEYWMVDPPEQYIEVWILQENRFSQWGAFGRDEDFTSEVLGQKHVSLKGLF